VNGSPIVDPNNADVRCDAVVDLISRVQRPFLWKVTVTGQPPHAITRIYEVVAKTDDIAARTGIANFMKEMTHPLHIFSAMI
jgi:hypothetical protein